LTGGKRYSSFLTLPGYCVLLISTCGAARAESGNAAVSDASMLQVMLGLGFVLALMGGLAWLLKRLGGVQQGPAGAIKILGGAAVGQRERVVLVEVADTWLVIGVAPGHVSPLHSMPKGEIRESAGRIPGNARFSVWLKQVIEKQAIEKQTTGKSGEHNGE
jgi:flagellar protein FliO/FliZ